MDVQTRLLEIFHRFSTGTNLSESVYLTLREGINAGLFFNGTRINEVDIAQLFQISRTPVQKALIRLECESLIVYEPKRGYIIQQLNFKQCIDYNEFDLGLYTISTIMAKNRHLSDYFNQLLCRRLDKMRGETDILSFLYLDNDFHYQIAQSTQNRELSSALERITLKGSLMFLGDKKCPVDPLQFIEAHLELNQRLYNMLINCPLLELVEFMEEEHNPHMRNLIGDWIQPT